MDVTSFHAPVPQVDRGPVYETVSWAFEPPRARHEKAPRIVAVPFLYSLYARDCGIIRSVNDQEEVLGSMLRDLSDFLGSLLNFQGINWWTLLGGMGLNFVITMFSSLLGAYLSANEATATFYQQAGPPLMVLAIFVACGVAGFITGKISDDVPVKHAFLSSIGAVSPFLFVAVMSFNPMPVMLALVAAAGNLNGGMLSTPRPRYQPPRDVD